MKRTLTFLFLIGLVACSNVQEEIEYTLDLKAKLSQAEVVFKTWDFDQMNSRKKEIDMRLDSVSAYYRENGMMMDIKVGLLMGDFKNSGKAFKRLTADYNKVKEEIAYSNSQLDNLLTDLQAGTIEKEAVQGFLKEEEEAVETLYKQVFKLDTIFMRSDKVFTKYAPKVDSLMASFSVPSE